MNRQLQRKAQRSLFQTKKFLKLNGIITTLSTLETIVQRVLTAFLSGHKAKFVFEKTNAEDLVFFKE
ncbi:hypothetical protein [uncultured Nostoc sp.]|uniref:hypothetical protein n=1 Tax=uncultured Nostoc sp. TaxID=340711 RepID=UPI0035CCA559